MMEKKMKNLLKISLICLSGSLAASQLELVPNLKAPNSEKVTLFNGDPYLTLDLDKDSPEEFVVSATDNKGQVVTRGRVVSKHESVEIPIQDYHDFEYPLHVTIESREYGKSDPKALHKGFGVAAFHGVVGQQQPQYHFVCIPNADGECSSEGLVPLSEFEKQVR